MRVCAHSRASLPASFRVHRLAKKDSRYSDLLQTKATGELPEILVAQDKADCSSWCESSVCDVLLLQNLPSRLLQLSQNMKVCNRRHQTLHFQIRAELFKVKICAAVTSLPVQCCIL